MKYAIVEELAGKHGVQHACEMLGVSTSGYYEWRRRGPSQRDIDDARLLEEIREVHMLSGGRFGARKVWHRLKDRGVACGLRKVTRLMRQEGLKSRCFRARRSITVADESAPPVPNVLNREFVAEKPNEKWVSDITQCRTRTGWIYLAVVLGTYPLPRTVKIGSFVARTVLVLSSSELSVVGCDCRTLRSIRRSPVVPLRKSQRSHWKEGILP